MPYTHALAAALLAWSAAAARGGYCPPQSAQSDGMRDILLVYAEPGHWRLANFLPYVAYVDREGQPRNWFYDAFLFLMYGGAPSGQAYIDGATNRRDWEFYLDEEFAPGREFAALDQTIAHAAQLLRKKPPQVPVIVMIPYPSLKQKDFGDADGDGASENLGTDEGRRKAVAWFLRAFLERWDKAAFPHLKLWGFYWMNEGVAPPDEAVVRTTAQEIHARGYKFHWIPWFRAPGVEKWRELGFDLTIMQPNYAFIPPAGLRRVPDENRLTAAANICRRLGMGIEMELNMGLDLEARQSAIVDPRDRINLRLYLDHGDDALDGYQAGAVRAYYQGYNAIAGLSASRDPELRQLYDDLYRFHKGTYERQRPYQPLKTQDKCLSDGRWSTRPEAQAKALRLAGPSATFTVPLGGPRLAGDVRVHFAGSNAPQRVTLALSPDPQGEAFAEVAAEDNIALRSEDGGGFAVLNFPPQRAQRLRLRVDVKAGESAALDELLLMPATHQLSGLPYTLGEGAIDEARCLTDGVTDGEAMALWNSGPGEARFELPETWYAEALLVHFRKLSGKASAPRAFLDGGAAAFSADPDGWAVVPLNRPVRKLALAFEDPAARGVAVDEVALLPAKNLASGCPYTYDPPFRAKYPDDGGRELTDGELSRGFSDGKTVGWAKWEMAGDVTVVVDLGAPKPVERVEVHAQGGGAAAVEFPERVGVAVSTDGATWTPAAASSAEPEEQERRDSGGRCSALGWLKIATPSASGRYVRLRITPQEWLMLSEVRVWSGGANAALGRPYSLRPQPTGDAPYADNSGLLTDGFYTTAGSGWKTCAGFDKAAPAVTVDLGAPRRIAAARVHLQGGGPGGVYFPECVSASTSADGVTWAPAGDTREYPPEESKVAAATFMGLSFEPREARFVRFAFKKRGWLMLDELEVFPADETGRSPH
mgnify:CR=1 FL=1